MITAQLIMITLASLSVARAFVARGALDYRQKWLNYPVAFLGGFCGAQLLPVESGAQTVKLLAIIFASGAAVMVYHALRQFFVVKSTGTACSRYSEI